MNHTSKGRKYHPCPSPNTPSKSITISKTLSHALTLMALAFVVMAVVGSLIK